MEVQNIPIPAKATIKISKEGKYAIFETKVIQTTDNKYIYAMPVRIDKKLVNFEVKGIVKELKVEFAPFEYYVWKNISIIKFVEDGRKYLRIKTTTPGTKALAWAEKPMTTLKKKKKVIENPEIAE